MTIPIGAHVDQTDPIAEAQAAAGQRGEQCIDVERLGRTEGRGHGVSRKGAGDG